MSYQRRMERGEFITCTAPYGYRIVNKKDLEIVPEEAATVRWIFDAYLKGRSSGWIAEPADGERHSLPVWRGMLERNGGSIPADQ